MSQRSRPSLRCVGLSMKSQQRGARPLACRSIVPIDPYGPGTGVQPSASSAASAFFAAASRRRRSARDRSTRPRRRPANRRLPAAGRSAGATFPTTTTTSPGSSDSTHAGGSQTVTGTEVARSSPAGHAPPASPAGCPTRAPGSPGPPSTARRPRSGSARAGRRLPRQAWCPWPWPCRAPLPRHSSSAGPRWTRGDEGRGGEVRLRAYDGPTTPT